MMKRFNKILALVLAMTLMFGAVSISASAAVVDTTNAAFKVRFVDNDGNAITSVAAGSTANVIVSIKTNGYSPIFAFLAFYDYTALTHIRQNGSAVQNLSANNCRELYGRFANTGDYEDADDALMQLEDDLAGNGYVHDWGYTGNITVTPHKDLMWEGIGFTDAQKAKYKGINFGYLVSGADSNLTVNTEGEYYDMVRFRFLAIADTELNEDTFFLLDNNTKTYITIYPEDMPLRNGQSSDPIKVTNLTVDIPSSGTPTPQPVVTVENISTQVQWQSRDEGLMRVGFRGNIKNFTPEFVEPGATTGDISNIAKLGVVYSKSDETPTVTGIDTDGNMIAETNCVAVEAYTIYDFTSGGYFFRAVVGNYDYQNSEKLYANAFIVIGDQITMASNAVTETDGAAEYARAVGAGMESK